MLLFDVLVYHQQLMQASPLISRTDISKHHVQSYSWIFAFRWHLFSHTTRCFEYFRSSNCHSHAVIPREKLIISTTHCHSREFINRRYLFLSSSLLLLLLLLYI